MNGNQFGGDKFKSAQGGLQRSVLGAASPTLQGVPLNRGEGNVVVAQPMAPAVQQVPIGKGAGGISGPGLRVMGQDPFGHEMGQAAPGFSQPRPQPRPQFQPPAPPAPNMGGSELGANQELHTLVAILQGPSGQKYEAVYEVVAQERGSKIIGVSERI